MSTPEMTNQERHQMYREQAQTNPVAVTKSGGVAVLLSLLLTGAGHLYAGHTARGFAWFFGGIVLAIATGFIAAPFIWIGAAVDAHYCAKH